MSRIPQYRQKEEILKKEEQRRRGRYHIHQRTKQGVQQEGSCTLVVCSPHVERVFMIDIDTFAIQIARYYDKYTAEIRASFERGTAL